MNLSVNICDDSSGVVSSILFPLYNADCIHMLNFSSLQMQQKVQRLKHLDLFGVRFFIHWKRIRMVKVCEIEREDFVYMELVYIRFHLYLLQESSTSAVLSI